MDSKKEKLLDYLRTVSGSSSKIISGLYISYADSNTGSGWQTVQRLTGVLPGILTTQIPSVSDSLSNWQIFTDKVISNWKNDFLVRIVWSDGQHPLINMEDFKSTRDVADDRKWNDLATVGLYLNRKWKKQLDALALFLRQLQKAGVITICDFLPYINDRESVWRGRPGKNGSVKLFQLTHDYLTTHHGLDSLIWAWSLDIDGDMEDLEEYWPGNKYVDIASVYMWKTEQLEKSLYEKLVKVVGDKPISMEFLYSVPAPNILTLQPRWTYFTTLDELLQNDAGDNEEILRATFLSSSVVNRGNNNYFKTKS